MIKYSIEVKCDLCDTKATLAGTLNDCESHRLPKISSWDQPTYGWQFENGKPHLCEVCKLEAEAEAEKPKAHGVLRAELVEDKAATATTSDDLPL